MHTMRTFEHRSHKVIAREVQTLVSPDPPDPPARHSLSYWRRSLGLAVCLRSLAATRGLAEPWPDAGSGHRCRTGMDAGCDNARVVQHVPVVSTPIHLPSASWLDEGFSTRFRHSGRWVVARRGGRAGRLRGSCPGSPSELQRCFWTLVDRSGFCWPHGETPRSGTRRQAHSIRTLREAPWGEGFAIGMGVCNTTRFFPIPGVDL